MASTGHRTKRVATYGPSRWETGLEWLLVFVCWPVVVALLVYVEVIGNLETVLRHYQLFGWDATWKKIKTYRLCHYAKE